MSDMLDRLEIAEVIDRYFFGLDGPDPALIRSCFADEAIYRSDAGLLDMDGGDEIGSRIGRNRPFAETTHVRGSQRIEIAGDHASAVTLAIAWLVRERGSGSPVMVRGLRYDDRLKRTAAGWKIVERRHSTRWQHDATTVVPMAV
jgi:hypothetical protein